VGIGQLVRIGQIEVVRENCQANNWTGMEYQKTLLTLFGSDPKKTNSNQLTNSL
jgi:hypothetical protein